MTQVAVTDTAHVKTTEEWSKDFGVLAERERTQKGELDKTIMEMGDLLVQWQPDKATLTQLANEWGYKRQTLEQRRDVALNIPPVDRNPKLSYGGHVEALKIENVAARNELLKASSGRSANLVRSDVREKRENLGEVKKPTKPKATALKLSDKLNWSAGMVISDGETVVKFRATLVEGQLQLTIDSTNPFDDINVIAASQGRKQMIEGMVITEDE